MITYDEILFVLMTIVLFLQGFYFGKRQFLRVVIVSLVFILSDLAIIVSKGDYTYPYNIHASMYEIVVGIVYVVFWFGLGYLASHLVIIREGDIGKVKILKIDK